MTVHTNNTKISVTPRLSTLSIYLRIRSFFYDIFSLNVCDVSRAILFAKKVVYFKYNLTRSTFLNTF